MNFILFRRHHLSWGLARISHKISAASADSDTETVRIDKKPDCSMSIRRLRRFTNSHARSSTFHALTTKSCEICGLANDALNCFRSKKSEMFGVAFCVFFLLFLIESASGVITELTVKEQAGVDRVNEPIRMGIPLPEGVVKEVEELALTTSRGKRVPCQFSEVARWLDDKSLKWVHVVFQTSIKANKTQTYSLIKGKAGFNAKKNFMVREKGNEITVETRALKLVIKKKGFNLFDSVYALNSSGPYQVISPHKKGFVATINGKKYLPGDDSVVAIHEEGSECVVLRASGRLNNGEDSPFSYICYIHVFQNSPIVKVDFSYVNASGKKPSDHVTLSDLSLILPTALQGAKGYIGGENKIYSGKNAMIVAKDSDLSQISVNGKPTATAKGKSTKPKTIGWGGLKAGQKGVYAGLRWFWQMHPKAIEVEEDSVLRVAMFAEEVEKPLDIYMGQGRTHYITLFFGVPGSDDELSDLYAGTQLPLRAVCSPEYYCRTTRVFGPIADAEPANFSGEMSDRVKSYDKALKDSIRSIEKKIDGHTYRGVTMDSYGYYPWGDVFHWANTHGVKNKWNILWESNYYDYPFAALLQFARTGDMQYMDICDRHGLHLADVFMCKYHPKKHLVGACRYSPPANHVGLDRNYKNPKPYVSVEFNHHKAQSILYRYVLMGDLHAKDDFMLALNNATLNPEGSWRQCRGAGAKLWTLTEGYNLTGGDEKIMAMMEKTIAAGVRKSKEGGSAFAHSRGQFMYGFATEGLIRYYWITKDKRAVDVMKVMNDWLIDRGLKGATSNSAMSMAFLWRHTGEEKYRNAALRLLKAKRQNRPKKFGSSYRSGAYALYYLSDLPVKNN